MRFAANLSLLYSELPVAERFEAAAADGFRYVEILAPYDESPEWYAQQLKQCDLELVLINTPVVSPDYPVGVAAQPDARSLFQDAMAKAASVCRATGCTAIHVMAGKTDPRYSREAQSAALHDNLRWASQQYPELVLQLEALNTTDVPDYFYSVPEQVAHELSAMGVAQAGMQFDFYHVVKEGLSPAEQVDRYFPFIRHVQIAGAPDRHEPNVSQDGLMEGIQRLASGGYTGYLGLEYRPTETARQGLSWTDPVCAQKLVVYHNATI